jgi:hypothetical protein
VKDTIGAIALIIWGTAGHSIGFLVALAASLWAAFMFIRGSITGAPPLYSKGPLRRSLHFIAGLIFALLAIGIGAMLVRK